MSPPINDQNLKEKGGQNLTKEINTGSKTFKKCHPPGDKTDKGVTKMSPYNTTREEKKNIVKKRKPKKGSRIEEKWGLPKIPDKILKWRTSKYPGLTDKLLEYLRDEFVDHWLADGSAKSYKKDWNAAFRTWIRRYIKWNNLEKMATSEIPESTKTDECVHCKTHKEHSKEIRPCTFHSTQSEIELWREEHKK